MQLLEQSGTCFECLPQPLNKPDIEAVSHQPSQRVLPYFLERETCCFSETGIDPFDLAKGISNEYKIARMSRNQRKLTGLMLRLVELSLGFPANPKYPALPAEVRAVRQCPSC